MRRRRFYTHELVGRSMRVVRMDSARGLSTAHYVKATLGWLKRLLGGYKRLCAGVYRCQAVLGIAGVGKADD